MEDLLAYVKQQEKVLIYGTGLLAEQVTKYIRGGNVAAYIVSSGYIPTINVVNEVLVYEIDKLPDTLKKYTVLIAVNSCYYNEIVKNLQDNGVNSYRFCVKEYSTILEITTKIGCLVDCQYCPQDKLLARYFENSRDRKAVLAYEDFKLYLSKIPKSTKIVFSGMCEPFLNDECAKMLWYAFQQGYKVSLYTTLLNTKDKDLEVLKQIDFEELVIHVPDCDNNAKIPITTSYMDNLKKVLSYSTNGRKKVTFLSCQGKIHPLVKSVVPRDIRCNGTLIDRAGNLDSAQLQHRVIDGPVVCARTGKDKLDVNVMLPDGTVVLCCMDYGLDYILGDLSVQSYKDIVYGEKVNCIIHKMSQGTKCICNSCSNAVKVDDYEKFVTFKENKS